MQLATFQRRLCSATALVIGLCVGVAAATGGTSQRGSAAARDGLIAFMRPGSVGEYDLWSVRPDGKALRRLTRSPKGRSDYNPVWSPNGSTVLFERRKLDEDAPGGDEALYVVNTRGAMHQVTHCRDQCWSDNEGSWSADGTRIAFNRATGPRSEPGP
jgi:Tol biopolymer transport system component